MALTRNYLKSLNLEAEVIEGIINNHLETVNAIKSEKEELENKFKGVDLVDLQGKAKLYEETNKKLTDLTGEYTAYKAEVEQKAVRQAKESKLNELLKANKANEAVIPLLMNAVKLDDLELDKEGNFKNSPIENLKAQYGQFFGEAQVTTSGANTITPPSGGNSEPVDPFLQGLMGK